ncbi:MAG TPA: Dyp-type peroxidase domain-containing protein, partial [Sphingomonadales bacterium]|nr:Dyp-type peroxidase domain-containing protein [Sphingomonadales bacterium]
WNVAEGRTEPMRSKEFAHDYRYFPEPDLLPLRVSDEWKAEIAAAMPELPDAKRARFQSAHGLSAYDAGVLTATRELADYFEATVQAGAPAKSAANWIQTELLRRLNDAARDITASPIAPGALADLIRRVEAKEITVAIGKKVFGTMFDTGKSAAEIIAAENLGGQVSDADIEKAARDVIAKNPDNVAKFKSGNEGVFKFFVGQVMKATRGQANPQAVNDILRRLLS